MEKLKSGDELEVLTDDTVAKNMIPQWSREHVYVVLKVEVSETSSEWL
jgi:TusA-related sulfurtransferase